MSRNILVIGGSSGIGLAVAEHYAKTDKVWSVSRRPSPFGTWIKADISNNDEILGIATWFADKPLDALLVMGGTWEPDAFTARYSFLSHDLDEVDRVLAVNCAATIKLVHALYPALMRSTGPKAVGMGALSAKEPGITREVANTAAQFGQRGALMALTKELPDIAFSLINPGNVATPEVLNDIAIGDFEEQTPIPLAELIAAIDDALNLSRPSEFFERDIHQKPNS